MEHLPDGINSVISLHKLEKGKRWLQLLLSAPQWNDQDLASLLQLLGVHQVAFRKLVSLNFKNVCCEGGHEVELITEKGRMDWTGALKIE